MTAVELAAVASTVAPVVRELMVQAAAPLLERIALLEQRDTQIAELKAEIVALRAEKSAAPSEWFTTISKMVESQVSSLPAAPAWKDADPDVIAQMVAAEVAKLPAPKDGEKGADGISVDMAALEILVETRVQRAMAAIPVPEDGKDGPPVDITVVDALIADRVKALPLPKNGEDGKSVDPDQIEALVSQQVQKAVAAIPVPKDGKSLTVDDVAPLVVSEVSKAVSALPVPKDGVGFVDAVVDRSGHLVLTRSDGVTKDVGAVVGRDVDMADVAKSIAEEVAKIPRPANGVDGKDGIGWEDQEPVNDEHGRLFMRYVRGDVVKQQRIPCIVDRGVYRPETEYLKGDGVSYSNSFWIAQADTKDKPSDGATAWRLAVRQGREGRQGPKGDTGPMGPTGPKGIDGKIGEVSDGARDLYGCHSPSEVGGE